MTTPSTTTNASQQALQPLLDACTELSDTTDLGTVRSLVLKILAEPAVFCGYDAVRATLGGQRWQGPEGEKVAHTLDLFSYGTYADYTANPALVLPLTDSQVFKLRQLTVLSVVQSFAVNKTRIIPYAAFQQALGLEGLRDVEQVLISVIYAGAVGAKLGQKERCVRLDPTHAIQARDVPPAAVAGLVAELQNMRAAIGTAQTTTTQRQLAVAKQAGHYQAFYQQAQDRKKSKEGGGWEGAGFPADLTAAVRRQKRSRGGVAAGVAELRFQL